MTAGSPGWRSDGPDDGPPLVLLNSVGSTSAMWDPLVGALAEQFRVIRIDHRGHGRSTAAPRETSSTLADLATDVLAVWDELDLGRADVAGVSLGGMVAMWLAVHRPERVHRLALICTSAHLAAPQSWLGRAATVRSRGMAAVADAVVARWITPELASRDDELVARLRQMVEGVDAESYAQCCEAIAGTDLRADLARIAAPTLVVAGQQDEAIPPVHAQALAAGIPGSELVILDPAAHVPSFEQPGRLAARLLQHFGGGASLAAGLDTRRAVLGDEHVDRALAGASEFTEAFQQFITRYAWGDVWTRPGLSRRDRSIATLAATIALGAEHEVALHVGAALRNGLSADEIGEVILHTAVYAGLPRANRAFAIAREVLGR